MGFWEWMGFENPRDSPKTEQPKEGLPKVTDNVRDSGQTFVFGRSNAGEQVDEKAAMQIPTVYACVLPLRWISTVLLSSRTAHSPVVCWNIPAL